MKLFASDIDNTLISQKEGVNQQSVSELKTKLDSADVKTAFTSGRYLDLVLKDVEHHNIFAPDFIIANVGTEIYENRGGQWQKDKDYDEILSQDWAKLDAYALRELLSGITGLELQEEEKQSDLKLSYYLPLDYDKGRVLAKIRARLNDKGARSKIIFSIDQIKKVGLIDIIPEKSGKEGAIKYLAGKLGVPLDDVLFAGDSGNDIDALTSGAKGVLVGNARDEVKEKARQLATQNGFKDRIYIAKQNYIKGVIEGAAHFGFFK